MRPLVADPGHEPPTPTGRAGPAPLGPDARRAVSALLRERARRLARSAGERTAHAVALLPVLLHASFEHRGLREDAPGVDGLRYRPRWSTLARAFALPPPCRAQRGRRAVEAVLVVPAPARAEVVVVVRSDLSLDELARLQGRIDLAEQLLAAGRAPVQVAVYDAARLVHDGDAAQRVLAFGALVAGHLSDEAWAALARTRRTLSPLTASALAAQACQPAATLALTLLAPAHGPGPLEAAVTLLARGAPLRQLADAQAFCVAWAGLVPGVGELVVDAMLLADAGQRRELGELLDRGRALAVACARAIHAARRAGVERELEHRWREALGPGHPRLLQHALGAALSAAAEAGQLSLDPVRAGRRYAVRLAGGALLGSGASPVQARVRALSLVVTALSARPGRPADAPALPPGLDSEWREVAARLLRPRQGSTTLLVPIAGGGARPGPPLDLLNRGAARALEFDGALLVCVPRGRHPSGRMLGAEEAVRGVVSSATRGAALEVVAAQTAARPVAARLAQIAALVRDPARLAPAAIEAGGRVLLADARGLRTFPLARFAARPRRFAPDPHAPDISISSGERQAGRLHAPGVVQCRVALLDGRTAALLFASGDGVHLRDEVPLAELEQRLREARAIVRDASPPAALAVRLSDGLEAAVHRAGRVAPQVLVAVRGALPWVEVEIAGERFGGRTGLSWRAAAEAILARCPGGGDAVVGVSAVTVGAPGGGAAPLLALYAAAVARRRLSTHLRRTLGAYRSAAAGRRTG